MMEIKNLIQYLSSMTTLTEEFEAFLKSNIRPMHYPKGHFLIRSGSKFSQTWFITAGLAKSRYINEDGKQIITRFWKENEIVIPKGAFMENMVSLEDIVLLEDSKLFEISNRQIEHAYGIFMETHALSRKIHFKDSRKQYQRAALLILPAIKAYPEFCRLYPCNRILLQDIAYFLNIRPYTLSRIRAKR